MTADSTNLGAVAVNTAGSASTAETTTITFAALTVGQTMTVGGVTYTAPAGGATAATVASYFADPVRNIRGFTASAAQGSTVVFTSNTES